MIKVTNGNKLWDGTKMYIPGDVIATLSEDEEDSLVEAGKAEYYQEKVLELEKGVEPFNDFSSKLIPDGNVETVQRYISSINNIDLLEKIAIEEETNKNRKTVLDAITKRAQELAESDDGLDLDNSGLGFNPEDAIVRGNDE